jgi:hypothetical protein
MDKEKIIQIAKTTFKVGGSMLGAYLISSLLTTELFVDYSPAVRDNLQKYIVIRKDQVLASIWPSKFKKEIKFTDPQQKIDYLISTTQQFAPGVRASSVDDASYIQYDEKTIKYEIYEVKLPDGRVVEVKLPKGMRKNAIDPKALENMIVK